MPRHVFVPEAYEQDSTARWTRRASAGDWERVYSPRTLVTALADRPGWERLGLTVHADGRNQVWIDKPDGSLGTPPEHGR